jgi:hypothetical protein
MQMLSADRVLFALTPAVPRLNVRLVLLLVIKAWLALR